MIAAIVPAYQRPAELHRCLTSVLSEAAVRRVIVINNGSMAITQADPRITVITPPANLGVGGGYGAGIKRAMLDGFTWLWLLDDDAWVERGALQSMLNVAETWSRPPAAIVPVVRDATGSPSLLPAQRTGSWLLRFRRVNLDDLRGRPMEVAITAWAGLLVRSAAVECAGLPDPQMFIDGDDVEFTYRLSNAGPIVLAPDAIVRHPQPAGAGATLPSSRMYYDVRNTMVFLLRHQRRRWLWPAELLRLWLWQLVLVRRSPVREWPRRCALLMTAFRDGALNRLGPRVDLTR